MVERGSVRGADGGEDWWVGCGWAGYYTASVASGRDDYYTGKGEAPGEWFGEGAPKSVSLLFHLGGRDISGAVRQAHDESVEATLGYMERDACVVPGCAWTASPARTCCARSPPSASARLTPPWRPGWHGT